MKKLLVLLALAVPLVGCSKESGNPEQYKKVNAEVWAQYVSTEKAEAAILEMRGNCISYRNTTKTTGYSTKDYVNLGDGYFYEYFETSDPAITKRLYYHDSQLAGQLYTVTEKPSHTQHYESGAQAENEYDRVNSELRGAAEGLLASPLEVADNYMDVDLESINYYVGKTSLKMSGKGTTAGENFVIVLDKESLFPTAAVVNYFYGESEVKTTVKHKFDCDADFQYYMPEDIGYIED